MTETPREDIYSGVVGIETVRLGFLLASMNDLKICAADVGNAFLYGKTRETVFIIAGPEFGEHAGKRLVIDKGLYGLKSSSARFHEHLSSKLRSLGFRPSAPDSDFWMKDMGDHYEYIATYVDDLLVMSRDPMKIIAEIQKDYILKGVGQPEYYLGGNVEQLDDQWVKEGLHTALGSRTYIRNVVEKLEAMIGKKFAKQKVPIPETVHPELDESPLLDPTRAGWYRAFIGSANWINTLGRLDIAYATGALARFASAPREGHLALVCKLFGYLKAHTKGQLLIDDSYRDWSSYQMDETRSWTEFYPDAEEELPPNMPKGKGKHARITVYVDADHAHDQATRRSVTGIIVFVNNTPIKWVSKRQKTVETSTYGSEICAARIATELILEFRYTLRMLGVNLEGPSLMLGDNMSVILNTTVPSSMLKKKHHGCAYHRVREAIAAGIISFHHVDSVDNYADLMTKPLPRSIHGKLSRDLMFRKPSVYDSPSGDSFNNEDED